MGIYLPNMEMPQKGQMLVISPGGTSYVCFNGMGERLTQTTAFPIPPHGDLISREWLIDIALHLLNTAKNDDIANGVKWLWQYIIDAPTIIPAEESE